MPRALGGTDREKCGSTSLELHPEKTRLEFRRFAAGNWKKREDGKPDMFNFLGSTHICGKKKCNGRGTDLSPLPFGLPLNSKELLRCRLGPLRLL
jgi:hypothetical protein